MIPASRFKRLVAYFIDSLCFFVLINFIKTQIVNFIFSSDEFVNTKVFIIVNSDLLPLLALIFYFIAFESSEYRATFGKRLLNLYVVDVNNQRLNFKKAFTRSFLSFLPGLIAIFMEIFFKIK